MPDIKIGIKVKDGYSKALNKAKGDFASMGQRIKQAGAAAVAGVAAIGVNALRGGLKDTLREAENFNRSMMRIEAMQGGQVNQFQREGIRDIAAQSGQDAVKVANAFYAAVSAGIPEGNIFSFIEAASRAALADAADIEEVVDGMTTVINSFGLNAAEAGQVIENMYAVVRGGKTDMASLARFISVAASAAKTAGVDYRELLAAVQIMTKAGVPTATAFQQVKNALNKMNDELGIGWRDSMSLSEGLEEMRDRADKAGESFKQFTGDEGAAGALDVLVPRMDDLVAAVEALMNTSNDLEAIQELQELGHTMASLDESTRLAKLAFLKLFQPQLLVFFRAMNTAVDGLRLSLEKIAKGNLIQKNLEVGKIFWKGGARSPAIPVPNAQIVAPFIGTALEFFSVGRKEKKRREEERASKAQAAQETIAVKNAQDQVNDAAEEMVIPYEDVTDLMKEMEDKLEAIADAERDLAKANQGFADAVQAARDAEVDQFLKDHDEKQDKLKEIADAEKDLIDANDRIKDNQHQKDMARIQEEIDALMGRKPGGARQFANIFDEMVANEAAEKVGEQRGLDLAEKERRLEERKRKAGRGLTLSKKDQEFLRQMENAADVVAKERNLKAMAEAHQAKIDQAIIDAAETAKQNLAMLKKNLEAPLF
jgi:TP901 family phage tail tape measure protein